MECENILLLDKFRCNLDPKDRKCKVIHWTECRNFQAATKLKVKNDTTTDETNHIIDPNI